MSKRFRDEDMLAHKGGGEVRVPKRLQRNKALEIVFDPQSHKEYITGFRKRKQQRRKEALGNLEKKQRQQRIEERAERRLVQREQLNLEQYDTDSDAAVEEGPVREPHVQIFNGGSGLTSIVTVAPIKVGSDSEPEHDEDGDEEIDEMPAAALVRKAEKEKQRAKERAAEEKARDGPVQPTKLSKCSLKIMSKTKAKIEGKKTGKKKGSAKDKKEGGKKGGSKGKKGRR